MIFLSLSLSFSKGFHSSQHLTWARVCPDDPFGHLVQGSKKSRFQHLNESFHFHFRWRNPSSVDRVSTLAPSMGTKYKCQHLPEVDRRPQVAKTTSTGARVWKDVRVRVTDRCKPYSLKQGDSGRRTKCCVFKCPHRVLLVVDSLEVSARTPGRTKKLCILGMQSSPIMNKKCSLSNGPHQPATCSKMRALTPLASQQKRDAIGSPSYRMQCAQSQGLRCLAWGGNRIQRRFPNRTNRN